MTPDTRVASVSTQVMTTVPGAARLISSSLVFNFRSAGATNDSPVDVGPEFFAADPTFCYSFDCGATFRGYLPKPFAPLIYGRRRDA